MGRMVVAVWLAGALVASCGSDDGGASSSDAAPADAPAPLPDAPLSCEALGDEWFTMTSGLKDCEVDEDCILVGAPTECKGDGIYCGRAVNGNAYSGSAAEAIETEFFARGCAGGVPDCGVPRRAACEATRCVIAEEDCCFCPPGSRSGLIIVSETEVEDHPELGRGADVAISYEAFPPGPAAYDDRVPPGVGCIVRIWPAGDEAGRFDEGAVTITGTRSPIPVCTFDGLIEYRCIADSGVTAAGDTLVPLGGGDVDVTIAAASFDASHAGMFLEIVGADDASANGRFPIVAWTSQIVVRISRSPLTTATQWSAPSGYRVLAGMGPTEAAVDFVGDSDEVTVQKAPGVETESFEVTVMAAGAGVSFDSGSATLGQIPTDGSAVSFTCSGAGGNCGTGVGAVLMGHTTTADVSGLPSYAMPPSTSGSYAIWLCTAFSGNIEIPADAMAVILATDPTRIEMRYLRANFALAGDVDGTNQTSVIVGHETVGYTDVP